MIKVKKDKRKAKQAKQRQHYRQFTAGKIKPKVKKYFPLVIDPSKATKSFDDLTDYEIQQIWAEAVHMYKTQNAELEDRELEELIQKDPKLKELTKRINELMNAEALANGKMTEADSALN